MKRIKTLQYISFAVLFGLILRIGWFSLIKTQELSSLAVAQQNGIFSAEKRGLIYDRSMMPLTESKSGLCLAVYPEKCSDTALVSQLTGVEISGTDPIFCEIPGNYEVKQQLLSLKGVYIANSPARYPSDGTLCHVIGYKSGDSGSGIEMAMDSYLSDTDEVSGIKLTIDYHMQKICENAIDNAGIDGAVILAEASTGNLLALASRPGYNSNLPADYLNSSNGELINRAAAAYDIGSVFKIVIAAAALSEGLVSPDTPCFCSGTCSIEGMTFYCHYLPGHGSQTFSQAFANSCNIPFYELGRRLGMKRIHEYATKLGFGKKVLNIDINEASGHIPNEKYTSARYLANLSIGQGDIQVTPLQVAKLLCIISNNGRETRLNLVSSILDKNNNEQSYREYTQDEQLLSSDVCRTLLSFMQLTVESGTGTTAKSEGITAAGKTGTAQTGWIKDGQTMTHGWFAGMFPAESPEYVCVVFAENGRQGSTSATPVFKEISENIFRYFN